jgi:two-component system chemotaxis sensor kinase CheA
MRAALHDSPVMNYRELLKDYLDDAAGHLNTLDASLLSLEKSGYNASIIRNMLGALHTLKGNSGMMGFESLQAYIHRVEDLLDKIMDEGNAPGNMIDFLFDTLNVIRSALQEIEKEMVVVSDLARKALAIDELLAGREAGQERQEVELSSYLGTKSETIKVDFKRLDELLNLVGELVIFKTRLNQIGEKTKTEIAAKSLIMGELKDALELMGKTIAGLQEGIMRVRMLPIAHVFHKFPRLVRDLSKALHKEVRLAFEGEETEIDKTVIDALDEPLLHMIRNAVDHGIEPPEERRTGGKNPEGLITLSAAQESNYVIIRVQDDGKGIDLQKVRAAGIRRGLIKEEDSSEREALLSLILSPGFTTRTEATDVSGRGVGLDVVSRNISMLNGHVSVDSSPGRGTVFTIKLPLSLAIIPALMAEAGEEVYAVPMSAVDESVKVREEDIHIINNREVIRFRERVIPVVRLHEFFGLQGRGKKRFYLIILGKADKRIALAVDRLRGRQEIVIKPLDETFGKSYGIAGASILGDGRIVLIVDVLAFWNGRSSHKTA